MAGVMGCDRACSALVRRNVRRPQAFRRLHDTRFRAYVDELNGATAAPYFFFVKMIND